MSMEFQSAKGIFLQIAENLCHQILDGTLRPGDRVPSVRDLAAEFEVNRNTVLRTYSLLNDDGIFENRRGVGYFLYPKVPPTLSGQAKKPYFSATSCLSLSKK